MRRGCEGGGKKRRRVVSKETLMTVGKNEAQKGENGEGMNGRWWVFR